MSKEMLEERWTDSRSLVNLDCYGVERESSIGTQSTEDFKTISHLQEPLDMIGWRRIEELRVQKHLQ